MEEKTFAMALLEAMKTEVDEMKIRVANNTKIIISLMIINSVILLGFMYSCYDSVKIRERLINIGDAKCTNLNLENQN